MKVWLRDFYGAVAGRTRRVGNAANLDKISSTLVSDDVADTPYV
jgi:hypothetical protein